MIDVESVISCFIKVIKSNSYFDDIKVIPSYSAVVKPTFMKKPVVAISIGNGDVKKYAVGEENQSGNLTVYAAVYVPFELGGQTGAEVAKHLCVAASSFPGVVGVSVNKPYVNSATNCVVTKAGFTLSDEFDFGGDYDE